MIEHIAQVVTLVGCILAVLGAWWRIDAIRDRIETKINDLRREQDMARHALIDNRIMPKFTEVENEARDDRERLTKHAERLARLERNGQH